MSGPRIVRVLLIVVIAIVAVVGLALLALRTPWAREHLRTMAEQRAESFLKADVHIGALRGSLLSGAIIDHLVIERDGQPIVTADSIAVDYDPFQLIEGDLTFQRIAVEEPVIHATRVGSLLPQRSEPRTSGGPSLRFDEIVVTDGRVVIGSAPTEVDGVRVPDVLRALQARLSLEVDPGRTAVVIERLSFVGEAPAVTLKQLTGTVRIVQDDLVLEEIDVQLAESSFQFGGTIENFRTLGGGDEDESGFRDDGRAAVGGKC
jgi:hypothetical protein